METVSAYALTTLARVKDQLFDPNKTISLSGASLTLNSTNVTGITVQTGKSITVGQTISGTGIPSGTTIAAIVSSSQITLSQQATATNTGQTLTVIDQPTSYDGLLTRYINSVTDYINKECGVNSFVQQTYVNDTYSIDVYGQKTLILRNTPVFPGADGIHVTSFQWRAGTPTNPSWTDFYLDQYELINPRTDPVSGQIWYPSGIIRVYGNLPTVLNNMIRATYTAGYPVDWPNAGNGTSHMLPASLTATAENLIVRRFKRRELAGKSSQSLEGANTSWRNEIDAEDLDVLGQFRQLNF